MQNIFLYQKLLKIFFSNFKVIIIVICFHAGNRTRGLYKASTCTLPLSYTSTSYHAFKHDISPTKICFHFILIFLPNLKTDIKKSFNNL